MCTSGIVRTAVAAVPLSNVCSQCSLISQRAKGSEMFDSAEKYKADFDHVRKIGSGKFGTVHQVRNVHSGDVFAAKVVK